MAEFLRHKLLLATLKGKSLQHKASLFSEVLTYIGESGQGAQITDTHQAQHKPFSPPGQQVRKLIQHGGNYPFQTCKLQSTKHTREAEITLK